jgi:hypothetical protein
MSDEEFAAEISKRVGMDRRTFVRRLLLGSAFAVPVVASFDLSTLTMSSADARTSNGTAGHTKLVATGAVVEIVGGSSATIEFFNLTATLTLVTSKAPLPEQSISFAAAGHPLGSAITDGSGVATLSVRSDLGKVIDVVVAKGYTAHFAGTAMLKPSCALPDGPRRAGRSPWTPRTFRPPSA